ncbi:MAG: hypothetical protein ACC660_00865 [Acidimicrobiales bacterium]
MESALAELSSVGTQLEDLTKRVVAAAHTCESSGREDVSHELFEVERSLRAASRRLNRATRDFSR